MIDRTYQGRRVRLDSTSDPLTDLRRGAEGTVRYYRWSHAWDDEGAAQGTLVVDWILPRGRCSSPNTSKYQASRSSYADVRKWMW